MIKSFTVTNHLGDSLFLDIRKPENTGFLVSSVSGLGPINASIAQTEFGMFDGSIISGSRLGPRNIVMAIVFFEDNNEKIDVEEIRHRSYLYFPIKKEIQLVVSNEHGDYKIKGIVESNEINIFTKLEGAQISILCADPYFEKVNEESMRYISRVVPNFSFPVSFEAIMDDMPPEEYQEDEGLEKIVDERGNVYYRYHGPFSVTSEAFNSQLINMAGKFSNEDITVNAIPYNEDPNAAGGITVRIGGEPHAGN